MGRLIFNIEDFNDTYQDLLDAVDDAPDVDHLLAHIVDDVNNLLDITDAFAEGNDRALEKVKLSGLNYVVGLVKNPDSKMSAIKKVSEPLRDIYESVINNIDGIDTWVIYRYSVVGVRFPDRNFDVLHVDLRTTLVNRTVPDSMCVAYIRLFNGVFNSLWGSKNLRI